MPSHKKIGGGLILTAAHGTRFKKRASGFNVCIGKAMKGVKHTKQKAGEGGRWDKTYTDKFKSAVQSCK